MPCKSKHRKETGSRSWQHSSHKALSPTPSCSAMQTFAGTLSLYHVTAQKVGLSCLSTKRSSHLDEFGRKSDSIPPCRILLHVQSSQGRFGSSRKAARAEEPSKAEESVNVACIEQVRQAGHHYFRNVVR